METRVLIQSAPKTLCSLSPYPNDATQNLIKIGQLALEIFKFKSVKFSSLKGKKFSKMSGLIRPKNELKWVFMPILFTSNFDDDSIKNERASMETPFSHYKSMGNFLDAKGS